MAAQGIDFARDIRPILSEHCFACHGPDSARRKADLRLDRREGVDAVARGTDSELLYRITTDDADERMPPEEFAKPLSQVETETLSAWISAGAPWKDHWAFIPPVRPPVPEAGAGWARGPIDAFIAARLEREQLTPSPEADRETLLRRLSFDLTGLPPTLEELDAFLSDTRPDAYERQVDRLLASPHYGEHMASTWLDLARYADTHGLHLDNERSMWPYRDWVVKAYNDNMPFDRFTIEQLAGDLLPDATPSQVIASGFNRCNPTSAEGGMIAEEYLTIYARDRVDTTASAFMGLTLACTKCHDHKYDPFDMREYYGLVAFFNSLDEEASDRNIPNPKPFVRVPTQEQACRLAEIDSSLEELETAIAAPMPEVDARQALWEREWHGRLEDRWRILVPRAATANAGSSLVVQPDDSVRAQGNPPANDTYVIEAYAGEARITALRLEVFAPQDSLPGRAANRNFVLTEFELEAYPVGRPEEAQPVPWAGAVASYSQPNWPIEAAIDGDPKTGWGALGRSGDRSAVFLPTEPFGFPGGTCLRIRLRHDSVHAAHLLEHFRLSVTPDPDLSLSRLGPWFQLGVLPAADGRAALAKTDGPEGSTPLAERIESGDGDWRPAPQVVDGQINTFKNETGVVYLFRTIEASKPRILHVGLGSDDGVRVWLNGELVHDNPAARGAALDQDLFDLALHEGTNELLVKVANYGGAFGFAFRRLGEDPPDLPLEIALVLERDPGGRSAEDNALLRRFFRSVHAPRWIALTEKRTELQAERAAIEERMPTTLVSRELATPRKAYVLLRGAYDHKGEEVSRSVPAVLGPMPEGAPQNRLGLARWLVSPSHPLTARVAVNRFWQQLFGVGIVKTSEDFGSQGEYPVHPELLDWLAVEFVESGWDVKGILREMVLSASYRQAATVDPVLYERDPENRLLARGPRFRLQAEEIRDMALLTSGLLVDELGGPPVRPYQPDGVWHAVAYTSSNTARYRQDEGPALWRRSLYTFWKRTAPPPEMTAFDSPSREACTTRRSRTVTPQQALVLWNDPTFVEAARNLAARALREGGSSDAERLRFAYRTVTSRVPTPRQANELARALDGARARYQGRIDQARALIAVGASPKPEDLDAVELAAWTHLATILYSLPETLTRG